MQAKCWWSNLLESGHLEGREQGFKMDLKSANCKDRIWVELAQKMGEWLCTGISGSVTRMLVIMSLT
jgi:hypothetical protein